VVAALVVLVILAGVAARPIAVRLWRAGLISDRALFADQDFSQLLLDLL